MTTTIFNKDIHVPIVSDTKDLKMDINNTENINVLSHSDDGVSQNENETSLDNIRQVEVHEHGFRWLTEANIIFISAATTFL